MTNNACNVRERARVVRIHNNIINARARNTTAVSRVHVACNGCATTHNAVAAAVSSIYVLVVRVTNVRRTVVSPPECTVPEDRESRVVTACSARRRGSPSTTDRYRRQPPLPPPDRPVHERRRHGRPR